MCTALIVPLSFALAVTPAQQPAPDTAAATPPVNLQPIPPVRTSWDFNAPGDLDNWQLIATGDAAKRMPKPKIDDGKLYLLESWSNSSAAAAVPFACPAVSSFDVVFTFIVNTGTEGFGMAWLDTTTHGTAPAIPDTPKDPFGPGGNDKAVSLEPWGWEAPNFARAFAIGFDASDPPNRDPFKGSGNVYDRPQHEVSLHWDGMEVFKTVSPHDFRDEKPHKASVHVEFVTGAGLVTLHIDDDLIFDRILIPSMTAFPGRLVLGARNGVTAGDVMIDDLTITPGAPVETPPPPTHVVALDRVLNDKDHGTNEAVVAFPADTRSFGRIVCTLRLDKPETRFDPWDRLAHVNLIAGQGETVELLRYITPYHRGHVWKVDVSDFRPLLSGKRKVVQICGTQGEGWVVGVEFDFYPGPAERYATQVTTLWSGQPEIGNPDNPPSGFFVPRHVEIPPGSDGAKVRTVVTGHGMSPNTGNAAEFMPIERTLTVSGEAFTNRLWKSDNYLNPCRPQGGTWKYDRAGWAPGDIVRPWDVDVTSLLKGRDALDISYSLAPYVNEARGKTWAPSHRTEAQIIFYADTARPAD